MPLVFREPSTHRFEDFELDVYGGVLRRGGAPVPLRAKSFLLLRLLVENPGRLITRDELLESIWTGRMVTDDSVHQCIAEVRAALGDERHQKIRTLRKRGYRFELPVSSMSHREPDVRPSEQDRAAASAAGSTAASVNGSMAALHTAPGGSSRKGYAVLAVSMVVLLILVALRGADFFGAPGPAEASGVVVLAALPLDNASPHRQTDAFVIGFHDVLLAELSRQPGLRIIGRWSLEHLPEGDQDPPALRRRLGADLALTGSVARDEAAIVFTFHLHDTRTGIQRWARSYSEALDVRQLLGLQRRVAEAVAREATVSIKEPETTESEPAAPAVPITDSLSAYEHYLDGLYFVRSIESGKHSVDLVAAGRRSLEAAIEADPDWAPPYAALARMLHFVASTETLPDAWREARRLVDKALELDPGNPEALVSLAYLQYHWGRDYEASERTYERVPGDGYLVNWGLALLYRTLGRIEESIARYERALRTDPLNPAIRHQYGAALGCGEHWNRALEVWGLLPDPWLEAPSLQFELALAEIRSGRAAEGRARWERHAAGDPASGLVHLALGEEDQARRILQGLAVDGSPSLFAAVLALELGETESALAWLEQLATTERQALDFMLCYRSVRALEGQPRFDRLLVQFGLR